MLISALNKLGLISISGLKILLTKKLRNFFLEVMHLNSSVSLSSRYLTFIFSINLGSIDTLTKLVLVNAVYFKGNWLRKFNPALTKVEPFFLGSKDNKMDVNMMV